MEKFARSCQSGSFSVGAMVKKTPCEVFVFLVGISLFVFFAGFAVYLYVQFSRPAMEKTIM